MSVNTESLIMQRRQFLKTSAAVAAGGLVVAFDLPVRAQQQGTGGASTNAIKFNAYIKVSPDDTVTFEIHKAEMGQGTVTSLSQILADEMECDWSKIRTEFPGVDPAYGPMMGVFGSLSIRTSYQPLRQAAAQAREMLITAAASKWGVDRSTLHAEKGAVVNAKGEKLTFGSLAEAAAKVAPPANAPLKDAKNFKLIGTSPKRLDTAMKVNGTAGFGLDVKRPGMLYASLERCPVFEGKVASFDATKAKAVPGVKDVVQISNGVAVIADNTWAAMEGRKALTVKWDEGKRASNTTAGFRTMFAQLASTPGANARKTGDAAAALASASKKLDAVYEAPFLCHAPMEPMNATAQITADGCDVWTSCQIQSIVQGEAARISGHPADKVRIHTQFLGGGFGRRGGGDFVGEAVEIAKHTNGAPVKLTWSREDDMTHDNYRPASYVKFQAGLGADGLPVAFTANVACQSFAGLQNGVDGNAVDGIANSPYKFANVAVDYHNPDTGVPCTYWRSVGYSQNTYFMESFLDEMALAAGQDPLEYRRQLLRSPRALAVLNLAAEKADWGKALPAGRARGVAVVDNIGSFNAIVAEVGMVNGKLKVTRAVCAVDCGVVVNPEILRAQIESGIVYGLSAALKTAITINKGRVEQTNFDKYDPLRIDEMPKVEVHIVPSTAAPGGIGEASTPTIVPAVINAVYALTKKRVRMLPATAAALA